MKRYFGILTIITLATSFNNVKAQVDSTKNAIDLFADLDKEAKKPMQTRQIMLVQLLKAQELLMVIL
jgi:hypothetical protein